MGGAWLPGGRVGRTVMAAVALDAVCEPAVCERVFRRFPPSDVLVVARRLPKQLADVLVRRIRPVGRVSL